LVEGRFLQRDNRFRVTVEIAGHPVSAHLPNSGRLTELLTPGRPCWLEPFDSPHRKTDFDLKLMQYAGVFVSVDARLPNALFAEALKSERLQPFRPYEQFEREVSLGESRLDFRLTASKGHCCWVEVKSVTLVEDGVARFPDAPTARGARHLRELTQVVNDGADAAVVFVVQRSDAVHFSPHDQADPTFGAALREAASADVKMYAWACDVSREAIAIARQLPIDLVNRNNSPRGG
jgi:sugar fermentation stimulation protein A